MLPDRLQGMALKLSINGQQRNFEQLERGASLNDLIAALEIKADRVALEHNGIIAPRTSWGATLLGDLDKIELVHFVGGGSKCERE